MCPKRQIAWLTLAVLSATLVAAPQAMPKKPHTPKASSDEPFRSFQILDAQLTRLTKQSDALKASLTPGQTGSEGTVARSRRTKDRTDATKARTENFRSMNMTAAGIGSISARLERLYQRRHQSFGVKTFRIMRVRAKDVQQDISAVGKAQTPGALDLATKRLDEGIVSLVLQFQAASGGYGAVRCTPGAWTCCEPKRSKDLLQSEPVACMWKCVPRTNKCTGFLGPRIRRPAVVPVPR
jgi:hypothetical protein